MRETAGLTEQMFLSDLGSCTKTGPVRPPDGSGGLREPPGCDAPLGPVHPPKAQVLGSQTVCVSVLRLCLGPPVVSRTSARVWRAEG